MSSKCKRICHQEQYDNQTEPNEKKQALERIIQDYNNGNYIQCSPNYYHIITASI